MDEAKPVEGGPVDTLVSIIHCASNYCILHFHTLALEKLKTNFTEESLG